MKGKITVRYPFAAFAIWALLLMRDGSGTVQRAFLAALLHESGHILCECMIGRRFPALEISPAGITMKVCPEEQSVMYSVLLAAAGPMANLLTAGICMAAGVPSSAFSRWCFVGVNLITAAFNLLPVPPLDGAVILAAMKRDRNEKRQIAFWNKMRYNKKRNRI